MEELHNQTVNRTKPNNNNSKKKTGEITTPDQE
jgi:hypothetical protein